MVQYSCYTNFRQKKRSKKGQKIEMIVALEEAKRRLVALYDVVEELKNQLRIEETKERCAELER